MPSRSSPPQGPGQADRFPLRLHRGLRPGPRRGAPHPQGGHGRGRRGRVGLERDLRPHVGVRAAPGRAGFHPPLVLGPEAPPEASRVATQASAGARAPWLWTLANGLAGPVAGVGCYQWALATTPSGVVLPIVATAPLLSIPIAFWLEGDRPSRRSLGRGHRGRRLRVLTLVTHHRWRAAGAAHRFRKKRAAILLGGGLGSAP